jgi:hypothetical protein
MKKAAKLTPDQVLAIRLEYAKGDIFQKQLGAKYDVEQATISAILRGASRTDVGGPLSKTERPLTADIARAIREEYRKGKVSKYALAKKYRVVAGTVTAVVQRTIWNHVPDLDPKNVEQYQASLLKPINPNKRLSDADAMSLFGLRGDTEPGGGE